MNKKILITIGLIVLAGAGIAIFYNYKVKDKKISSGNNNDGDNFIQSVAQSPAVEGDIVNSGITGNIVFTDGKPFEASLEIFKAGDFSKPFISIRTHSDGTFQVPLKPGNYVLKPMDPDGPIAPAEKNYNFTIGNGQWLQVKVEYNSINE